MKEIVFSPEVLKKIKQIKNKDAVLYKKIKKQLNLFQQNPHHTSLRTHKLTGKLKNTWSISVDRNYRMIYVVNDEFYFINIGTHDEVYK